jgi:iron(III) transport system substrate-binding protein
MTGYLLHRKTLFLSLAVWAAFLTAGCRQPAQPEVVVYVAVDRGNSEPILGRFEQQTGIGVRALYDAEAAKTTGLVSRLWAESGRPRCDVFWNNEIAQTLLLADRGLLASYQSEQAAGIPEHLKDPAGYWTGVALRARVIVYNTKHVAPEEAPRSIFDLTEPRWRGKVAIADPQFGTTRTHVAALFAALGPEKAQAYLNDLLANDVRIVDGNAMVKNLVARAHPGASPVFVGLTDTDDVLSGQAEGDPIEMVFPDQDTFGTLLVPSTVCLINGAPHPDAARQLVDYLVSETVQSQLTADRSGYMPVRPDPRDEDGAARLAVPRGMKVSREDLLEQLEPSTRWTRVNFHP